MHLSLRISASCVKDWFQYKCERKLVYSSADPSTLARVLAAPVITKAAPWSDFGREFESRVLRQYAQLPGVRLLRPGSGQDALSPEASLAFVRGQGNHTAAATQLVLSGTPELRRQLGLEATAVDFKRGIVDLAIWVVSGGKRRLRLVDIKSTGKALPFHKMQVAWYAWMLRGVAEANQLDLAIDETAEIWHQPPPGRETSELCWAQSEFRLAAYEAIVRDWCSADLPRAAKKELGSGPDRSSFHLYFKCEQCEYADHCLKAVSSDIAPSDLDLSAIPGMTHQAKATLTRRGVKTVGAFLSNAATLATDATDWALSARGHLLRARASSLVQAVPERVPGAVSLRMPPKADVKILLVLDRDPMQSRLATIATRIISEAQTEERIELVPSKETELSALAAILSFVSNKLKAVAQENAEGASQVLHFFTFEPAESKDLAEALGRHVAHQTVGEPFLNLIRIFPPDGSIPEPGYRGFHHLPLCAVRSVIEELYALPVPLSYDLRRVCEGLRAAPTYAGPRYEPEEQFRQRFSSRLPLTLVDHLQESVVQASVRADVARRLDALEGLVSWLEAENATAEPGEKFLRLKKAPFQLHASIPPLGAQDLEVLRAQVLLNSRVALVETLQELAQTRERRGVRKSAITDMVLVNHGESKGGGHWMLFRAGLATTGATPVPGDRMLLLSDGHPDRVLDPTAWADLRVDWHPRRPGDSDDRLFLTISKRAFGSATFRDLWEKLGPNDWVLDKGHYDINSGRLESFLEHVAQGE